MRSTRQSSEQRSSTLVQNDISRVLRLAEQPYTADELADACHTRCPNRPMFDVILEVAVETGMLMKLSDHEGPTRYWLRLRQSELKLQRGFSFQGKVQG